MKMNKCILVGVNAADLNDAPRNDVLRFRISLTQKPEFSEGDIIGIVGVEYAVIVNAIHNALNLVAASAKSGDLLFFFYSGHGVMEGVNINSNSLMGIERSGV